MSPLFTGTAHEAVLPAGCLLNGIELAVSGVGLMEAVFFAAPEPG
jgi:hypothetical protein